MNNRAVARNAAWIIGCRLAHSLLQLLIGSVLMICLGIIGHYVAKIYEEIKDRPRYILSQACGGKDDDEEEAP